VIVWTRFYAAEVPPDQAVNAVPRDELVSIGSSMLLIFGFFGVLALLAMYLIDRGGRATPGVIRGLLALLLIEGVTVIMLVDRPLWQRGFAALVFLLPIALAVAATFANAFVLLEDKLPGRKDEKLKPRRERARFRWLGEGPVKKGEESSRKPWKRLVALVVALLGVGALALAISTEASRIVAISLAALLVVVYFAHPVWKYIVKTKEDVKAQIDTEDDEKPTRADEVGAGQEERLEKRRPYRLVFRPFGMTLFATLLVLAAGVPSLLLEKFWLFGALGAAAVLFLGLWRIAALSTAGFQWFGLAVFISVPLFGTLTAMAINLDDPRVQPMALIRKSDGPDKAIQGLYVTETDDRVYFATLSTEGCGDHINDHSGRLLWVPRSEVVAMSIGPAEDIEDARETALEMAYALTPAVETPAGDHVSLTEGEQRAETATITKSTGEKQDQRLENVGAAVRPNFGIGLRLVPENVSAGDIVTLRMSRPDEDIEGFGVKREGHTLRLGGVPVPIVREKVRRAADAEFVKTADGKILALDKEGVYKQGAEGFVPLDEEVKKGKAEYVRLADDSGASKSDDGGEGQDLYLEVAPDHKTLTEDQEVRLGPGDPVGVEPRLLRQAWHENHIKFRVPDNASSGVVSVECEQLAGQPLLRVARPPVARIAVRMSPGSPGVVLDSKRSRGGSGEIVSRWWTVEGLRSGSGDRIAAEFPSRPDDDYVVGLTVTDSTGQTDSASFRVLRVPAKLMRFRENISLDPETMKLARSTLFDGVQRDAPSALEFDGAPSVSSVGAGQTLKGEEELRDSLLFGGSTSPVDPELMVRTLAYDRSCPLHDGENIQGGVDVVMLSSGVQVVPPLGCRPGRVRIERGASLAPPEKPAPDDRG
jgi:MFS family permease